MAIAVNKRRCKAKRYLKDISVEEVSIVTDPANLRPFCLLKSLTADKAGDADLLFVPLAKARGDRQVAYGIVYEPDETDGQDEAANAEEIEKAAHGFMLNSQTVGRDHEEQADAAVVESYIAPQVLKIGGEPVKKGAWVMAVKVNDKDLWESIKKGERTGFSMGGRAASDDGSGEEEKAASLSIAKASYSQMWGALSSIRSSCEAIGSMLGGTLPAYPAESTSETPVDGEKAQAALVAMSAWLENIASVYSTTLRESAAQIQKSEALQKEQSPQKGPSMTPEEAAKLKADHDALAAENAALKAQAKADAEARDKAAETADAKAVEAELAAYRAKREAQAKEMVDRIVADQSSAPAAPADTGADGGASGGEGAGAGEAEGSGTDGDSGDEALHPAAVGEERPDEDL